MIRVATETEYINKLRNASFSEEQANAIVVVTTNFIATAAGVEWHILSNAVGHYQLHCYHDDASP